MINQVGQGYHNLFVSSLSSAFVLELRKSQVDFLDDTFDLGRWNTLVNMTLFNWCQCRHVLPDTIGGTVAWVTEQIVGHGATLSMAVPEPSAPHQPKPAPSVPTPSWGPAPCWQFPPGVPLAFQNQGPPGVALPFQNQGPPGVALPFQNQGQPGVPFGFQNQGQPGVPFGFQNQGPPGVPLGFSNQGAPGACQGAPVLGGPTVCLSGSMVPPAVPSMMSSPPVPDGMPPHPPAVRLQPPPPPPPPPPQGLNVVQTSSVVRAPTYGPVRGRGGQRQHPWTNARTPSDAMSAQDHVQ
eukprot:s602_g12.t1